MRKDLIRGSIAVIVFTVLLGLVYPLVMTGISQVAFPGKADVIVTAKALLGKN